MRDCQSGWYEEWSWIHGLRLIGERYWVGHGRGSYGDCSASLRGSRLVQLLLRGA